MLLPFVDIHVQIYFIVFLIVQEDVYCTRTSSTLHYCKYHRDEFGDAVFRIFSRRTQQRRNFHL